MGLFCLYRKEAEHIAEEDLTVQLDVFDEQKASDEEQLPLSSTEGLDLSSHTDIFTAIIKQVSAAGLCQCLLLHHAACVVSFYWLYLFNQTFASTISAIGRLSKTRQNQYSC